MTAYKKLKKQDSYLTSYTGNKSYTVKGSKFSNYGINTYIAISGSSTFFPSTSTKIQAGTDYEHYSDLTYDSIYHLYYSNFDELGNPATSSNDPSGSVSGSTYENYMQSSFTKNVRRAQGRFTIISIPRKHFGTHLTPGTVQLLPDSTDLASTYVTGSGANDYVEDTGSADGDGYVEDGDESYGSDPSGSDTIRNLSQSLDNEYINFTESEFSSFVTSSGYTSTLIDDGNGNLIIKPDNYDTDSAVGGQIGKHKNVVVGNVIYPHGLIIITNPVVAKYYGNYFLGKLKWRSSHPIYTYNYNCSIKESEYNFTQNPSAVKDSSGSLADNVTGSYFQPYFTTVGLYNEASELVAVAKMAQPVPVSEDTEMTIKVKLDT